MDANANTSNCPGCGTLIEMKDDADMTTTEHCSVCFSEGHTDNTGNRCFQTGSPADGACVWFFVDVANVEKGANINYDYWRIEYSRLFQHLLKGRTYAGCTAFVAGGCRGKEYSESCRRLEAIGAEIDSSGYYDENQDCQKGVDVALAISAINKVSEDKLDVAIVLSGDGDFVPLAVRFSKLGKRLEFASFRKCVSKEIYSGPYILTFLDEFPIAESVPRFEESPGCDSEEGAYV